MNKTENKRPPLLVLIILAIIAILLVSAVSIAGIYMVTVNRLIDSKLIILHDKSIDNIEHTITDKYHGKMPLGNINPLCLSLQYYYSTPDYPFYPSRPGLEYSECVAYIGEYQNIDPKDLPTGVSDAERMLTYMSLDHVNSYRRR